MANKLLLEVLQFRLTALLCIFFFFLLLVISILTADLHTRTFSYLYEQIFSTLTALLFGNFDNCNLALKLKSVLQLEQSRLSLMFSVNINVFPLTIVKYQTVFRSPDIVLSRMVGLSTFNVRYKLNCLSLWMCLLHLGHDNVVARLMYYAGLVSTFSVDCVSIQMTFISTCILLAYILLANKMEEGKLLTV
jgi:hypothetical protein